MNRDLPEIFNADSRDPYSCCAGGKTFEYCDTAQTYQRLLNLPKPPVKNGHETPVRFLKPQIYFPLGCVSCRHMCEIALDYEDGAATGDAILSSVEPDFYLEQPSTRLTTGFINAWLEGDWSKAP